MGISGHILGPKKLRKLSRETGVEFTRAFRYHRWGSGYVRHDGVCNHYEIDYDTMTVDQIPDPIHWASCREAAS